MLTPSTHMDRMLDFLTSGKRSDVTFLICNNDNEKVKVKAHKLILRIGSSVFDKMFEENTQDEYELKDFQDTSHFNAFLKVMECGVNICATIVYI